MSGRLLYILVFCLLMNFPGLSAQRVRCNCYDVNANADYKNDVKKKDSADCLFFSNYMRELYPSEAYKDIEYIIYEGNDWDYETREIPSSWMELKNLKGILLRHMSHEAEIKQYVQKIRPDVFVSDYYEAHGVDYYPSMGRFPARTSRFEFSEKIRIPYSYTLDSLIQKKRLSPGDSLYILKFMLQATGDDAEYYHYAEIKAALADYIDTQALYVYPSLELIDELKKMKLYQKVRAVSYLLEKYEAYSKTTDIDTLCTSQIAWYTDILTSAYRNNRHSFYKGVAGEYCRSLYPVLNKYRKYMKASTLKEFRWLKEMAVCE